jgi:microcystin-dependent protein
MACTNCFDNCLKGVTLDTCTRYTGAGDETLGISSGDSLYSVLNVLIDSLANDANPTYTAACTFLSTILGSTGAVSQQTMINGLQTAICCLKDDVTALQSEVDAPIAFDTSCLDVASDATLAQILQAAFTKICANATAISTISGDYVKASQLCTLVTQCLASSASTQEYTKMNKYIAYPYHGPTTVFDSSGNGLSSAGYSKVYMCLGQTINGFTLPDYRGRSPMGANTNIPTSGMDSNVDPSQIANAGYALANKQKNGTYTNTLSSTQIPSHTHTVVDPGHQHFLGGHFAAAGDDNNYTLLASGGSDKTLSSTTGISLSTTGGGQAHNTTHPVMGCIMIMYIP